MQPRHLDETETSFSEDRSSLCKPLIILALPTGFEPVLQP